MMDEPYILEGCGRIVICRKDSDGTPRAMIGGVLIGEFIEKDNLDFELWDVEISITVRRKHKGSPLRGGTMNQQLTGALNRPEDWQEKTFDTLMPERRVKANDASRSRKRPKRSSTKQV